MRCNRVEIDIDIVVELEQKTFRKLWELSEPGTPTADLFFRVQQTEHFLTLRAEDDQIKTLPDVSIFYQIATIMKSLIPAINLIVVPSIAQR